MRRERQAEMILGMETFEFPLHAWRLPPREGTWSLPGRRFPNRRPEPEIPTHRCTHRDPPRLNLPPRISSPMARNISLPMSLQGNQPFRKEAS